MLEGMVDLKHELEKHSSKLKDCQQKIKHYQNEVRETLKHSLLHFLTFS